jgi:Autophagy-related protein 27
MMLQTCMSFVPLVPLFFSSLASAAFECTFNIPPHHFNLSPLKGIHSTFSTIETPPTTENTTIFIDLCQDLHWDGSFDAKDRCEDGTQGIPLNNEVNLVCVIKYNQRENEKSITQIIPTAGEFPSHSLDASTTLIQSSSEVEGVRIELHGQIYQEQRQSTVLELNCDTTVDVPVSFERKANVDWIT